MEWKNLEKDGPPNNDSCCLVSFRNRMQIEKSIYNKAYNQFELDDPDPRFYLYPLDVEFYMEYDHPYLKCK